MKPTIGGNKELQQNERELKEKKDFVEVLKMYKKTKYNGEPAYVYYNANPKGKRTDDCVVRAIAEAEGRSWEDVLRQLVEYSIRTGYMVTAVENYTLYFEENGW